MNENVLPKAIRDFLVDKLGGSTGESTDENEVFMLMDTFPVLYSGWECDDTMWLVMHHDKRYVVGTNHGRPCFASAEDLLYKSKEYMDVLGKTINAMMLIKS